MTGLLLRFARFGIHHSQSPLYGIILNILEEYFSLFPDEALYRVAQELGIEEKGVDLSLIADPVSREAAKGAAYMFGRMIIGKKVAAVVAERIAIAIAATTAYRIIATRIGLSAGASAPGVGLPIGSGVYAALFRCFATAQEESAGAVRSATAQR